MLGLFNMLNLGARSLQTQQTGTEVAGHNIANVNNPAYSRQRLAVSTTTALPTSIGPEGTGVGSVAISQLRDGLIDAQIKNESSTSGSLTAQQNALAQVQSALGQSLDSTASTGSTSNATGKEHGLGDSLSSLFTEFQNLANAPTSLAERQIVLTKASELATKFNQTDKRLSEVQASINRSLTDNVAQANELLSSFATLNKEISTALARGGEPNDLMDTRQSKIEALSSLINVDVAEGNNGALDLSISGVNVVTGSDVTDPLTTCTDAGGRLFVGTQVTGTPLALTGGALHGLIDVRDGALANLRADVNSLASELIAEVNAVHSAGYDLNGGTGLEFFSGSSAADIRVNSALLNNPSALQASGVAGTVGDNQTALALAQLAQKSLSSLSNQTFSQSYSRAITALGQESSSVNTRLGDQKIVQDMLLRQRDSLSGVSLDEEMTDMMKFQKAFQASAKIVSTIDEMLNTIINMKQ